MEDNDNYKLTTWGSLWKFFGISKHTYYGFYWGMVRGKLYDLKDWVYYYLNLSNQKIPLFGESSEDFYIRRFYGTSADCFARPICTAASNHFKIVLRNKILVENREKFILVPDKTRDAINFGSYNYLGFGGVHPIITPKIIDTLQSQGLSLSGFASERGVSDLQEELENKLAKFLHKEMAIVVPMGYATNSTLIPILAGKGDVVFSDALNHSSMIIGIKSANCEKRIFKHNDMLDLKKQLIDLKKNGMKNGQQPNKVIVIVEGLYSMEGEFCKLKELIALKKVFNFYLYVDEAHSIGALGETGRGITEHLGCNFDDIDILMGTFSKSFAAAGGYIASDAKTIQLLKSNCYSNVYGSAMCPVEVQQIMSCLDLFEKPEGKKRIAQLRKNSIVFRRRLKELGAHVLGNDDSPVIPVMTYHPFKLQDISRCCLKNGLAIVVVGYPACPITACRIRFCMSASHTDEDIERSIEITYNALKESSCLFFEAKEPQEIYHAPNVTIEELLSDITKEEYYREMTPLSVNSDKREIKELPVKPKDNQIELSSYDLFDFENNKKRIDNMIDVINIYGCGSCGPRQFYGGTLEHLNLEEILCKIYNTTDAVVYSYGNNTLTSIIPCYGKKDDIILVDELCNYPIQLGCRLARAKTIKFKHNDFEDLKQKLDEQLQTLGYYNQISIVTEGVFQCDYSIAPLKEYSTLRKNNVLLIVDDSLGIGAIGKTLKGSIEHAGLTMNDIDMLCGSLEFVCDGVGGFVVGKYSLIDKQRLFGAGYIFSASAPPFTCNATKYSLEAFEKNGEILRKELEERRTKFNKLFEENNISNVEIINKNDNLPYILINSKDNKKLVENLRNKGYYTVIQQHLQEDWCQSEYVRFNLGIEFNEEKKIKQFLNALKSC